MDLENLIREVQTQYLTKEAANTIVAVLEEVRGKGVIEVHQ